MMDRATPGGANETLLPTLPGRCTNRRDPQLSWRRAESEDRGPIGQAAAELLTTHRRHGQRTPAMIEAPQSNRWRSVHSDDNWIAEGRATTASRQPGDAPRKPQPDQGTFMRVTARADTMPILVSCGRWP